MKRYIVIAGLLLFAVAAFAADQRILYTEKMVGSGHPSLADTLNRLTLVGHNIDGTHKDNNISGTKILDNTITSSKILDNTITSSKILDNTITGSKILDNTITGSKILDNTIANSKILDNTISGSKILDNTITNSDIPDNTISGTKILDNTITSNKIQFRGVLAYHSTTQRMTSGVLTKIQFDSERYDTTSFHSLTTNNTRLTVPNGVTLVRLSGQVAFTGSDIGFRHLRVYKDGTNEYLGLPYITVSPGTGEVIGLSFTSPALSVVGGNYFELVALQTSGETLSTSNTSYTTWFAMEIVQ